MCTVDVYETRMRQEILCCENHIVLLDMSDPDHYVKTAANRDEVDKGRFSSNKCELCVVTKWECRSTDHNGTKHRHYLQLCEWHYGRGYCPTHKTQLIKA